MSFAAAFAADRAACAHVTVPDSAQTFRPTFRQMVFIVGDKIIHGAVWMRFLPLGVQMVDIHPTCAPTKNTEKCVVSHMSCDATQRSPFEATLSVGSLNGQQTNRSTEQ